MTQNVSIQTPLAERLDLIPVIQDHIFLLDGIPVDQEEIKRIWIRARQNCKQSLTNAETQIIDEAFLGGLADADSIGQQLADATQSINESHRQGQVPKIHEEIIKRIIQIVRSQTDVSDEYAFFAGCEYGSILERYRREGTSCCDLFSYLDDSLRSKGIEPDTDPLDSKKIGLLALVLDKKSKALRSEAQRERNDFIRRN